MVDRTRTAPLSPDAACVRALLRWFERERRPLPWRRDRDPYSIWISEVLLQQTRVAAAIPYYERFLARFPDVDALARARPQEVLRLWQGAGYYARARHLSAAARTIVRRFGARFPSSVEELETLPGVGPYIARAVASLAFDRPVLALEANGRRIAARLWGERGAGEDPRVVRRLTERMTALLPPVRPGAFNEAWMELGETVCHPRTPACPRCPIRRWCRASAELEDPGEIPRRRKRAPKPHVRAAVVVLRAGRRWLLHRRPPTGLLGGMYEFPGGKIHPGESPAAAAKREWREETGLPVPPLVARGVVHHSYSHFSVELHVFEGAILRARPTAERRALRWVDASEMTRLPLPAATVTIARRLGILGPSDPAPVPRGPTRKVRPNPALRRIPSRRSSPSR